MSTLAAINSSFTENLPRGRETTSSMRLRPNSTLRPFLQVTARGGAFPPFYFPFTGLPEQLGAAKPTVHTTDCYAIVCSSCGYVTRRFALFQYFPTCPQSFGNANISMRFAMMNTAAFSGLPPPRMPSGSDSTEMRPV